MESPSPPLPADRRIDGWKAIAAYFGRDRTTMYRWARERGLPVRSIPGGKTRTVYALVGEIEAWRRRAGESAAVAQPPAEPAEPRRHRVLPLAAVASCLVLLAAYLLTRDRPGPALPRDHETSRIFLQARDDWASRSRLGLAHAIAGFETVSRRDPGFAPARADLADAYLLEGEAGSLPADQAFAHAAAAAEQARRLDPGLPAAARALGFIAYWRDHDRATAARLFGEALRLAPDDPQTQFWYANILADNGEAEAARRAFDKARLLDPGSVDIETDRVWADWSAGDPGALARLRTIVAANPGNAEARDCLGDALLAAGDDRGYLEQLAARARLRGEPGIAVRARALEDAWRKGGRIAMLTEAVRLEMEAQADLPRPEHAEAALYASLSGDRTRLLATLQLADRLHEQWGSAGFVRLIATRWSRDPEVMMLLAKRRPPAIAGSAQG